MRTRRLLGILIALAMTIGLVSFGTVAMASPGHDDEKPAAKQQDKKSKKSKKSKTKESTKVTAAPVGVLGTKEAPRDIEITMTDTLRFDPGAIAIHRRA